MKLFPIAGVDQKFVKASARIDNNRVIVWSHSVANPATVRYALTDNPDGCNLYQAEGVPASPSVRITSTYKIAQRRGMM